MDNNKVRMRVLSKWGEQEIVWARLNDTKFHRVILIEIIKFECLFDDQHMFTYRARVIDTNEIIEVLDVPGNIYASIDDYLAENFVGKETNNESEKLYEKITEGYSNLNAKVKEVLYGEEGAPESWQNHEDVMPSVSGARESGILVSTEEEYEFAKEHNIPITIEPAQQ